MNKAVFLDRDGTINREVNYLKTPEEFEFIPGAVEALKLIAKKGYLIIVITNQSGVARKYLDLAALRDIHEKMLRHLEKEGVRVDGIYYCPHHPEEGCDCRKPDTGMIKKAQKEHDIDLASSYLIGDSTRDIRTGINAGCRTVLVATGYGGRDGSYDAEPDYTASDLLDAAKRIIK